MASSWTSTVDIAAGGQNASSTDRNTYIGLSGNLQYLYDNRIQKIQESVLALAAATITFSSIPGTYRHLMIDYQGAGDAVATDVGLQIRLNSDTGANYDQEYTHFSGATPTAFGQEIISGTSARIGDISAASAPAHSAGAGTIMIPYYSGVTFFKNIDCRGNSKISATTPAVLVVQAAAVWKSQSAVTAVQIFPASGNFVANFVATLYGMN